MSNKVTTQAASQENFERLQLDPAFSDLAEVIAEVLRCAFDDPAAVEVERWTLSCLPATNKSAIRYRLFTLNVGPMEMLYVECELENGEPVDYWMSVYVSSSALESATGCSVEELDDRHCRIQIHRTSLSSADGDGVVISGSLIAEGEADEFDSLPLNATTIRPLAERLVAKGKGPYAQYHNRGFAQFVLEGMVNYV